MMLFKQIKREPKKPMGDHKGRTLLDISIVGCDPCGRPFPCLIRKEHHLVPTKNRRYEKSTSLAALVTMTCSSVPKSSSV